jgi:hypothetical protein
MSPSTATYATDEDLAILAPADFPLLAPSDLSLAAGSDGRFHTDDRWTLRSSSIDPAGSGLRPGDAVLLLGPPPAVPAGGDLLIVDAVTPDGLRLRRKGLPAGVGSPPCPAAGATGLSFRAATLRPRLTAASEELDRCLGASPRPDPAMLREAVALRVLQRRYLELGQRDDGGPWLDEADRHRAQLHDLLARFIPRLALTDNGTFARAGVRLTR